MDAKSLMEMVGKLDKGELLNLICFVVNVCEPAKKSAEDYCRMSGLTRETRDIGDELKRHWKNAQPTVEMFNTCGGGPKSDEDDVREELENMKELLGQGQISWDIRKAVLDELLEEVASDNSGLTDVLVELAMRMCVTREEKLYLADFLADYGNPFYKNYASGIYMENCREEKKEEAGEVPVSSADYMALAGKYKNQGNDGMALQTVLDGLEKAEGRLFEIYSYLYTYYMKKKDEKALEDLYRKALRKEQDKDFLTELMYGHYKEQKNYAKKKEMLLDMLSCADSRKLGKWYGTCCREFTPEDLAAEEGNILQKIKERNPAAYFDICIEKGNTAEVLKYLSGRKQFTEGNADAGHRISKQLASAYPREIAETYWREAYFYAQLGEPEDCTHAVSILREIHEIMEKNSWTDEWNEKYNDFIRDSISNPVLIGELAKF